MRFGGTDVRTRLRRSLLTPLGGGISELLVRPAVSPMQGGNFASTSRGVNTESALCPAPAAGVGLQPECEQHQGMSVAFEVLSTEASFLQQVANDCFRGPLDGPVHWVHWKRNFPATYPKPANPLHTGFVEQN